MTRRLLVLAAAVLVLTPAAAFAGTSTSASTSASKQCTALRAKVGAEPFAQAFATFGGCVSNLTPVAVRNTSSATALCRSLRAQTGFAASHGGKSFARFYGAGPAHRNAFANCVLAATNAKMTAQVSKAATCLAAQSDASFAASHGGKTFAQAYGTNADLSDALGRCIVVTVVAPVTPQPAPSTATPQPSGQSSVIERECGGPTGAPLHPMINGGANCTVAGTN